MIFKKVLKRIVSLTPKWMFNFFVSFTPNKKYDCFEESLESFYPDEGHSSLVANRMIGKEKHDLKIIVPCYNAEKHIDDCVKTIINQKTKYDVITVLVDDGSIDSTLSLIKKYESDKIKIITKQNGGSASARNAALSTNDSEFVMFIDSDDYLLGDQVLDLCLDAAYSFKKEDNKKIIIEFKHSNSNKASIINSSLERVEYTKLSGFPWGKIFSTSLFDNTNYPEGYWFEDTVLPTIIFPQADMCFLNKTVIYFYRPTENSMTAKSTKSIKTIDTFYVTRQLLLDREKLSIPVDYNYYYRFYMQTICNAVRLKVLPYRIQQKVFIETSNLFREYSIKSISEFKQLYKSFCTNNFKRYLKYCSLYSKMYLNL